MFIFAALTSCLALNQASEEFTPEDRTSNFADTPDTNPDVCQNLGFGSPTENSQANGDSIQVEWMVTAGSPVYETIDCLILPLVRITTVTNVASVTHLTLSIESADGSDWVQDFGREITLWPGAYDPGTYTSITTGPALEWAMDVSGYGLQVSPDNELVIELFIPGFRDPYSISELYDAEADKLLVTLSVRTAFEDTSHGDAWTETSLEIQVVPISY